MVSPKQLNNLWELIGLIKREKISGDLVECGVWKGGCVATMVYRLEKLGLKKKIWLFDSFQGLPEPTGQDGRKASIYAGRRTQGRLVSIKECVATLSDVKEIFSKLGLPWRLAVVKQGWFQETLPKAEKSLHRIALLRLDGDWYESTKICLKHLFPKVVSGGFIVVDDYYYWEGCRRAVDKYLAQHHLRVKIKAIDDHGVYFLKP